MLCIFFLNLHFQYILPVLLSENNLMKHQGQIKMSCVHHHSFIPRLSRSYSLHSVQFSSVQFSRSVVSDSLQPHESQHARPPCPSPTPGVHSDSSPSSQWYHPAISSSVVSFSSCPQSLPALDCKEIQPVHSEGDQPWDVFGRNDAKAETPVLWPPPAKSWLTGKDSETLSTQIELFLKCCSLWSRGSFSVFF